MENDSSLSDKDGYKLCPNARLKTAFGFGILFQLSAFCLGISMLCIANWMTITVKDGVVSTDKFTLTRHFGPLQECYLTTAPANFSPPSIGNCYIKNMGQFNGSPIYKYQKDLGIVSVSLLCSGIILNGITLLMAIHFAVLWCKAPYDTPFMRNFRLAVGIVSIFCSVFYLFTIVVYHLDLDEEVMQTPYTSRITATVKAGSGYVVAWVAEAASLVAAWLFVGSTCCWAINYVNCSSVAAAFYPPCSQKKTPTSQNGSFRPNCFQMDSISRWSINEVPTLPRFQTATYGDGQEIRKTAVA